MSWQEFLREAQLRKEHLSWVEFLRHEAPPPDDAHESWATFLADEEAKPVSSTMALIEALRTEPPDYAAKRAAEAERRRRVPAIFRRRPSLASLASLRMDKKTGGRTGASPSRLSVSGSRTERESEREREREREAGETGEASPRSAVQESLEYEDDPHLAWQDFDTAAGLPSIDEEALQRLFVSIEALVDGAKASVGGETIALGRVAARSTVWDKAVSVTQAADAYVQTARGIAAAAAVFGKPQAALTLGGVLSFRRLASVFRRFLVGQFAAESLDFYLETKRFAELTAAEAAELGREMCDIYLDRGAETEVNVSSKARRYAMIEMSKALAVWDALPEEDQNWGAEFPRHMFQPAQRDVWHNLVESFQLFLTSAHSDLSLALKQTGAKVLADYLRTKRALIDESDDLSELLGKPTLFDEILANVNLVDGAVVDV
jgi:hypothetical protein